MRYDPANGFRVPIYMFLSLDLCDSSKILAGEHDPKDIRSC
jgi:hypothetical protein